MPARLEKKRSRNSEGAGMTTPAAKWKAAERARHKEAGRVAVTHYIYPADRAKVARYIKRLNERSNRAARLKCCGNGVVPLQAAAAAVVLVRRMIGRTIEPASGTPL